MWNEGKRVKEFGTTLDDFVSNYGIRLIKERALRTILSLRDSIPNEKKGHKIKNPDWNQSGSFKDKSYKLKFYDVGCL